MDMLDHLNELAIKYNLDLNHNLRYLELSKLIRGYAIKDLLILGCGKGFLEYILPDEINCTSIDVDPLEIEIAQTINRGKSNRTFISSDIFGLPIEYEKRFQAVVISEVIEHIRDDEGALRQVSKHMRPSDGVFILTVPNIDRLDNKINMLIGRKTAFMSDEHLREYSMKRIRELLGLCGFDIRFTKHVYLRFPKELFVRKLVPIDSKLRKLILALIPSLGTYIILVSYRKDRAS
jgi:SAM-dependent methyltransferase